MTNRNELAERLEEHARRFDGHSGIEKIFLDGDPEWYQEQARIFREAAAVLREPVKVTEEQVANFLRYSSGPTCVRVCMNALGMTS